MTYDAKGNTLTVTKLATTGNAVTTTMTYEPVYNQVATVTDPRATRPRSATMPRGISRRLPMR